VFKSANNTPLFLSDSYTLVDGRLAIQNESRTWELALWGKNLGDVQNVQEAFGAPELGTITRSYNAPRTYGLTYTHFWQ
jgi:iron complex outermembrane receptor protein